jgi:extradiol dioxygenase family protein
MNLEIVVIPVSDVDRAKRFYGDLGGAWMPTSPPAMIIA